MIPNNNFYGKKSGKTIKDFTAGFDYKLETVEERLEFLRDRLGVKNINNVEYSHDFFTELFDQTFDSVLDKDGVYWVEEEQKHMTCDEFKKWADKKGVDIGDYLDIQTAFNDIDYCDDEERGKWVFSNTNTSSVKLILNSTDAQYSESNIAKELSKMADYLLVKDRGRDKKEKIKLYSEEEFKKRLRDEKKKLQNLEEANGDEFAILKNTKNYRLAPKIDINKSDFKMPFIYSGTYEDYLNHWKTHQYKINLVDGKSKKTYLKEDELCVNALSECLTKEQWNIGKSNMIKKMEFLNDAMENKAYLENIRNQIRNGQVTSGLRLMHVTNNMKNINDYMIMTKEHYHNYVCIKPDKCSVVSNIMDVIDYSNDEHVLALLSLNASTDDLNNDISILSYDINNAIQRAFDNGELGDKELKIIKLLRQGETKKGISEKIFLSRVSVYKKLDNIVKSVKKYLNK